MPYFKNFQTKANLKGKGITPKYPDDFLADIAANRLPAVSWVLPSVGETEHPALSEARTGEKAAAAVLSALTKNRELWSKTALIITWDENGGFFDHVPPPVPPKGTKGEFLTVSKLPAEAQGIRGPIGLGFRIPTLIVSPFSRGGFVSSGTFDHTSVLRLLETRFGAEVPNLTAWRRQHTGDLTSAFNFAKKDMSVPNLPKPPGGTGSCFNPDDHPTVPPNKMPKQVPGKARRPSGVCKR
jgi:phospholipase C